MHALVPQIGMKVVCGFEDIASTLVVVLLHGNCFDSNNGYH